MNKPIAIVYTSNTGFTKRYAEMLSKITKLPLYNLDNTEALEKGSPVIFCGWLFASNIKGYKKALKRFSVCAVMGVGLCETGSLTAEVRKTAAIAESIPLFIVQGGMCYDKLKGVNKFMIKMLRKFMTAKKDKTDDEKRMLELVTYGGDYVSEENLAEVIKWYESIV